MLGNIDIWLTRVSWVLVNILYWVEDIIMGTGDYEGSIWLRIVLMVQGDVNMFYWVEEIIMVTG